MRSISARRLITILILASLLLVSGLVVFAGIAANDGGAQGWLFSVTGEEALLPQLKGLSDLAAGALRARVQTADLEPVRHAGVNPFGVNVFLEQEVEPAELLLDRAEQGIDRAGVGDVGLDRLVPGRRDRPDVTCGLF